MSDAEKSSPQEPVLSGAEKSATPTSPEVDPLDLLFAADPPQETMEGLLRPMGALSKEDCQQLMQGCEVDVAKSARGVDENEVDRILAAGLRKAFASELAALPAPPTASSSGATVPSMADIDAQRAAAIPIPQAPQASAPANLDDDELEEVDLSNAPETVSGMMATGSKTPELAPRASSTQFDNFVEDEDVEDLPDIAPPGIREASAPRQPPPVHAETGGWTTGQEEEDGAVEMTEDGHPASEPPIRSDADNFMSLHDPSNEGLHSVLGDPTKPKALTAAEQDAFAAKREVAEAEVQAAFREHALQKAAERDTKEEAGAADVPQEEEHWEEAPQAFDLDDGFDYENAVANAVKPRNPDEV